MRGLDAILRQPWAIVPEWLHTIVEVAQRHVDLEVVAERHATTPEALSARIGARNEWGIQVRDGIAIVPVTGPIFPRANLMTQYSGATSLDMLAYGLQSVIDDDAVKAILLDVDSPGGVAFGIGEMAEMIRGGTKRKPITAYVAGLGASAAYWIASAASEIVMHPTAMVGSIGVVTGVPVQEQPDNQGVRTIEVVSTNAPNKRPDPRTEEGIEVIRKTLDDLEAQFIDNVARHREVSRDVVLADFGQGSLKVGEQAVAVGMADRLGTFEETLAGLSGGEDAAEPSRLRASKGNAKMTLISAETIAADHPEVAEALRNEGRAEAQEAARQAGHEAGRAEGERAGAEAERSRIAALESAALPGYEAMLEEHKADGSKTDVDLMRAQTAAQKKAGVTVAAQLADDEKALTDLPAPGASAAGPGASSGGSNPLKPPAGLTGDDLRSWAQERWAASEETRGEFKRFDAYLGYLKSPAAQAA